jgi:hypothetical protein
MKLILMTRIISFIVFLLATCLAADAQQNVPATDSTFKPSGKLWGYSFGDYYYKVHSDQLNRGGANQYTGIEKGRNAFQFRRIYLGYNYDIHPKFSAELLLAAEDNVANRSGVVSGDLLSNNKLSFYIKLANLRWKNIWKGTDFVIGQISTPAYSQIIDPVWNYRSIERTITDIRRVSSYDLGAALQGKFDPSNGKFGYDLMVSNGTGAKPENDRYKWFSGDVYAKLFDKKLILQLYADYQRLNWSDSFHHARNMVKGFAAYTTPVFTIGVESFLSHGKQDVIARHTGLYDTLSANAVGTSIFLRGQILKDKLNYFARADVFNPYTDFKEQAYDDFRGLSSNYDPNTKETFLTAGLDFMPIKNVHFMPNVWYNKYNNQRSNVTGTAKQDHDLVYRLTFYYVYGK